MFVVVCVWHYFFFYFFRSLAHSFCIWLEARSSVVTNINVVVCILVDYLLNLWSVLRAVFINISVLNSVKWRFWFEYFSISRLNILYDSPLSHKLNLIKYGLPHFDYVSVENCSLLWNLWYIFFNVSFFCFGFVSCIFGCIQML